MTSLETRQPDFPENPSDGFQIKEPLPDGGYVLWAYDADRNAWTYEVFKAELDGFIYTDQVLTRSEAKASSDESTLYTQRDVNHYLDQKGVADDGFATKDELAALQVQLAALQGEVDNLSGLLIQARYEQGTGLTTRPGQFVCIANDTQQNRLTQGTELRLYETDLDQKAPALMRVIVGDYITINESTTGLSCQLHVTYSAGTVIRYDYMVGTLDRISDRVPYQFRISGQA